MGGRAAKKHSPHSRNTHFLHKNTHFLPTIDYKIGTIQRKSKNIIKVLDKAPAFCYNI
jgi:hypothetical protein